MAQVGLLEKVRRELGEEPPKTVRGIVELAERRGLRVRVVKPSPRDPLLYVDGGLVAAWLRL